VDTNFQFLPDRASSYAGHLDALYFFLIGVTTFFTLLIFVLIVYFALKYRRRPGVKPQHVGTDWRLEVVWFAIPIIIVLVIFVWGSALYVQVERPPAGAMEISVVGKQWMWKIQHPEGKREIDELHVPTGRPVRLIMTSQDVIHSFYVPAFRTKQDVIPGRYTTEWFTPSRVGEYHLFCAEYCGMGHSKMIGRVVVMEPAKYQAWLAGTGSDEPMAQSGEKLFATFSCNTCHGQRAPTLAGLYGRKVQLQDGSTLIADEDYIRESILNPSAKITAGYPPIMPTYAGQISEEQVMQLIAYIKTLKDASSEVKQSGQ
jgi:cytochrome c oxidase subunit 2